MYSEQYFRVRMDPRPEGLWVVVSHPPTRRERAEGPVEGGRVQFVIRHLIETMQRELVPPDALRIQVGLALEGHFVRVEHLPTGRSRSTTTHGEPYEVQRQLLDELVTEVGESGLLAVHL